MKLSLLFAAVINISFAYDNIYQLSLTRVESRRNKMIKDGTWGAYYIEKQLFQYYFNYPYQKMNDFDELEFLGELSIGTPPQKFKFHFDITSMDFWITDKSCGTYETANRQCPFFCYNPANTFRSFCDPQCKNHGITTVSESLKKICNQKTKYDSTKSSTFYRRPNLTSYDNQEYEFGYLAGLYLGEDKITFEASNNVMNYLSANLSSFMQTISMSPVFVDIPFDGILGIGAMNTFLSQIDQKMEKMYTLAFQYTDSLYNDSGASITFGGLNKDSCEAEIIYESTLGQYSFVIFDVSFDVPTTSAQNSPSEVTIDTARTSIYGPAEVIKSLKEAAGAAEDDGTIDCDANIKDLSIQMGMEVDSKVLTIPAKYLIIHNSDGSCTLALEPMPKISTKKWIFGTPWLRSYCNIFSFEDGFKIGFSKYNNV